ncbi:MAG TPA: hypothetical protein VEQ41_09470 [Solirubrobacterales bacterium]|nr:hypothetical protein [Solirubrobacterales bacterium]
MQTGQLKRLIETGAYRPDPCDVAQAMLERRAVRELLTASPAGSNGNGKLNGAAKVDGAGKLSLNPADRIQSPSAVPRQAA